MELKLAVPMHLLRVDIIRTTINSDAELLVIPIARDPVLMTGFVTQMTGEYINLSVSQRAPHKGTRKQAFRFLVIASATES